MSIKTHRFHIANALLAALSGSACQQPEAKSPDPASSSTAPAQAPAASTPEASPHQADEQAAHASADAWLALIDQKQYAQSWDATAPIFQSSVTKEKWEQAASAAREPLGELSSRKFHATEYKTTVPGAPDGEYVTVYYDTTFANKAAAMESVTLMKSDGAYKVAGYFIK
jgi:hypothetical protein